jgi:DNA-binding beta-propeller fold protein YncE
MHASLWRKVCKWFALAGLAAPFVPLAPSGAADAPVRGEVQRRLYVAEPGIRNYLEYGGHGLLVFDIDNGHRFIKRIPTAGLDEKGVPINVKGICANARTKKVYISTIKQLMCIDLVTEKLDWERVYPEGCDRPALSPDGQILYVPSFEGAIWNVVDAATGDVIAKVTPNSGAHNTIYGLNGAEVYLAGLKSPILSIASTKDHTIARTVGPFSNRIRPFTVNGRQTLVFVNCNELLGFEIGDLKTGKVLHQVVVQGFQKGPVKRHGCPSHGIGMTPDEKEIWVVDAFNQRLHIFDATVMPPKQVETLKVRDEPGWITFSIDGRLAYPATGDVIDVKTRQIVTGLKDETGREVQSEKLVEIDFQGNEPVRAGNQFGIGQVTGSASAP